jgi:uncharacterized protein (DUF983 family)
MDFIKKGKKLYSIVHFKCPCCQEGDLFSVKNAYIFKTLDKMPNYCEVCGTNLLRETGFYYGAMMISHATTTIISVSVHLTIYQFYGWEILPNLIPLLIIILGLFPLIFRSSRAIWINIFVKYDVDAKEKKLNQQKK